MKTTETDVVIVGAGPAGLSAALILGRCRRRVLIVDANRPRNAASRALHGFLTRDGIAPGELRRIGRRQLAPYKTVHLQHNEAQGARRVRGGFEITLRGGRRVRCRKLLLATGVVDQLPEVAGMREMYGRGVFHCPYCDGWEHRDRPVAVYARTAARGMGLSLELLTWSRDVTLCTDGRVRFTAAQRDKLARRGIVVRPQRIARLAGRRGRLDHIVFANGETVPCAALFFSTPQRQGCDLPSALGCGFTHKGAVKTGDYEATDIPGLYVAGDASRFVQLAIVAAAEGAQAAFAINQALSREDLRA